jgi:hypothetical protein
MRKVRKMRAVELNQEGKAALTSPHEVTSNSMRKMERVKTCSRLTLITKMIRARLLKSSEHCGQESRLCKIRHWKYNFPVIHVSIEEIKRRAAIKIKLGEARELNSVMLLRQHTFPKII